MYFEQNQNVEKQSINTQEILETLADDDELKELTEEDLKAIYGGRIIHQIYGSPIPYPERSIREWYDNL